MRHRYAIEDLGGRNLNVAFGDSGSVDAFSRLRVSNPQSQFATQCQYNADPTKMGTGNSGDGVAPAYGANSKMVQLQISNGAAGGTSWIQSFEYVPYQPGKSQEIVMTGVMGAAVAGAVKNFGYGDDFNGIFYRQNGTGGLQFVRRTTTSGVTVDNPVNQVDWNLDRMDGTGSSGVNLSVDTDFILFIDLQFLGMGRVRVGFDVNGVVVYAHEFLNANVLTVPYMQTATLPVRAEIIAAAGLGATVYAYFKCATVISEGGFEIDAGLDQSAYNPTAISVPNLAAGGPVGIIHMQPTLNFPPASGVPNRTQIVPESFEFLVEGNNIRYELWVGLTFGVAPAYANVNATYSGVYFGTGGTGVSTATGIRVFSGYATASNTTRTIHSEDLAVAYPLTLNRGTTTVALAARALGTLSLIAICLNNTVGQTATVQASFNWREVR